jgi:hypothetical protein
LREGTLGDRSDQIGLIGKPTEEIVQLALQATYHAPGQAGDQGAKSQRTAAGEIGGTDAMGCDEFVGLKCSLGLGKQRGMEVAKSLLCIPLKNKYFAGNILSCRGLNLTALGLSPIVAALLLLNVVLLVIFRFCWLKIDIHAAFWQLGVP